MTQSIPAVEFGFSLFVTPNGVLTRGPVGVGDATSVQFPDTCATCPPGSKLVATIHSHPKEGGGSILPSAQDIREAGRLKMPYLCIINNEKIGCNAVKGVSAAQVPQPSSIARLIGMLCK